MKPFLLRLVPSTEPPHLLTVQTDEIDELFNFSTDNEDSGADFDQTELEQIEMLDQYRSNLVASSGAPMPSSV